MTLRDRLRNLRTRWRRCRLLRAYRGVFAARTGKRVGFTPHMAALDYAEQDDVLSLEDGEVIWHWPENDDRILADGSGEGVECSGCGRTHNEWERDGEHAVDSGSHSGVVTRWECQHCGEIEEVPRR